MCIRIIGTENSLEFNPSEPLENQVSDAKEIIVNYDPYDLKIPSFVGQIELMIKNGVTCTADIKVNPNNYLEGIKLERYLEKLKLKLDINEMVKGMYRFHNEADRKLCEMSEMLGKINEQ